MRSDSRLAGAALNFGSEEAGRGREGLAASRMVELLACLGASPPLAFGRTDGVGRLLDRFCPGAVLHGLQADGWPAPVGHLVVAARGAVVVVASLPEDPLGRARAVREALCGRRRLRCWLGATPWAGAPVLAAVCVLPLQVLPRPGQSLLAERPSAHVVGDVWVGHAGRLPAWLASGGALGPGERTELRRFLLDRLAIEPERHADKDAEGA